MVIGSTELLEELIVIDWDEAFKIIPDLRKLVEANGALIRNGLLYSNNGKIIKHLPMKKISIQEAKNILLNLSGPTAAQVSISGILNLAVLGAVIVQTQYLSQKIDVLKNTIDSVLADVEHQNSLYYLDKISNYLSIVESAKFFLKYMVNNSLDVKKNTPIINKLIGDYLIKHNELFVTLGMIITKKIEQFVKNKSLSKVVFTNLMDFIKLTMDFLPKGTYVLSMLCDSVENFSLSDRIIEDSNNKYKKLSDELIDSYKKVHLEIAKGSPINPEFLDYFNLENTDNIKLILNSKENNLLLSSKQNICL